jgi:hypothetical protein
MKSIAITLILFMTIFVYSQKIEFQTITINPYLSFQNYEHFKRLILSSPDSDVEYIEGFKFNWGYTYKLSIKRIKMESTLSDGTQFKYSLEKIITKTKEADTSQFTLYLDAKKYYHQVDSTEQEMNKALIPINDSTFLYFDSIEIEVPTSLIQEFQTIVESKTSKVGTFIYMNEKRIRLIKL